MVWVDRCVVAFLVRYNKRVKEDAELKSDEGGKTEKDPLHP